MVENKTRLEEAAKQIRAVANDLDDRAEASEFEDVADVSRAAEQSLRDAESNVELVAGTLDLIETAEESLSAQSEATDPEEFDL